MLETVFHTALPVINGGVMIPPDVAGKSLEKICSAAVRRSTKPLVYNSLKARKAIVYEWQGYYFATWQGITSSEALYIRYFPVVQDARALRKEFGPVVFPPDYNFEKIANPQLKTYTSMRPGSAYRTGSKISLGTNFGSATATCIKSVIRDFNQLQTADVSLEINPNLRTISAVKAFFQKRYPQQFFDLPNPEMSILHFKAPVHFVYKETN